MFYQFSEQNHSSPVNIIRQIPSRLLTHTANIRSNDTQVSCVSLFNTSQMPFYSLLQHFSSLCLIVFISGPLSVQVNPLLIPYLHYTGAYFTNLDCLSTYYIPTSLPSTQYTYQNSRLIILMSKILLLYLKFPHFIPILHIVKPS